MRKFLLFVSGLLFLAVNAEAKRYIVTVQNDTRAPVNWEAFVTRSGGEVVKTYNFIDGALLDLPEEQARRLMDRRAPGMTIEEDKTEYLLDGSSVLDQLNSQAGAGVSRSAVKKVPQANSVLKKSRPQDNQGVAVPGNTAAEIEIPWGVTRISAPAVWTFTEGAGVKVAVIDTGINFDHEDLKANYGGGVNFTYEDTGAMDGHGHGTHVAGTIAAVRNSRGVVGVAPKAKIYAVKVMSSGGTGERSAVISGIEWAIENKMNVINMSLGSAEPTEAQHKALKAAYDAGIIVVASAGNRGPDGVMSYPARFPETIAVAALDLNENVASFSSRGEEVDVIAPGVRIYSTTKDGGYGYKFGTSMACPHVSGLAALALSAGYDAATVRNMIKEKAVPIKGLSENEQGKGLANVLWLNSAGTAK